MIYIQKPQNFNPKFEVVSCFFEHDNMLLFLHRPKHKSQGNKWGLPGGKIDIGETKEEAMLREIIEETSVELSQDNLNFLQTVYVSYPTHDFIYHMYKTNFAEKPQVKLRVEEHDGFDWFEVDEVFKLDLIDDMEECIRRFYIT